MKLNAKNKVILTSFIAIALLSSCDAPRASRAYVSTGSTFTSNSTSSTGTTTTTPTTTTTTTPTTTTSTFPTDVSSTCKFSSDGVENYIQSSTHAGSYNLCKSTTSDNTFYFQSKVSPVDTSGKSVQICFIPMTTSGTNSIYIGNPMCGYFTDNKAVKKISFVKYAAYSNATISGVMFFKDTSYYYSAFNGYTNTLTAFQTCMNALYYGNTTYCNSFKSVGQYVFQNF